MKKIVYLLGLIIISACTDRLALEEKPSGSSWNLTVRASKNSEFTKALSESGTTLLASFSEGDKVYVYKPEESSSGFLAILSATKIGELTAQSSGASTTFTGSVDNSNFSVGDQLLLAYCGVTRNYSKQDGTLATIAKNCDYAYASLNIQTLDSGTKKITTNAATFQNQQAVLKLTFQDLEGKPLTIKTLTVGGTGGNNLCDLGLSILGALNITLTNPSTVVYAALHNIHQGVEESYTFTAKDTDDEEWICRKKVAFLDGKFYSSTLKMTKKSEWVEPYVTTISSVDDLMLFAEHMNSGTVNYYGKTVTLTSDLDLAGVPFVPIGSNKPFAGTFDGGGHTIRNLEINKPDADGVGFFGALSATAAYAGTVNNLHLENCSITGKTWVGGIVGNCSNNQHSVYAQIENCSVSGTIMGMSQAGGIVGKAGRSEIRNCSNSASVIYDNRVVPKSGSGNNFGGIAGFGQCKTITGCTNTGNVSGGAYVGGIIGSDYFNPDSSTGDTHISKVSACTNSGEIQASTTDGYVGGIIGYGFRITIQDCVNDGSVTASQADRVGGIIGYLYVLSDKHSCEMSGNTNTGIISGLNKVGGIIGDVSLFNTSVITNCVSSGAVSGSTYVGRICGINEQNTSPLFSNCYYTTAAACTYESNEEDDANIYPVFGLIAAEGVSLSNLSTPKATVKEINYYLSGDTVSFTGAAAGYTASSVDLTANGTSYTITMPASDVTISAN